MSLIKRLEVDSLDWPAPCLLVDMRGVETLRNFVEQFKLGEQAARRLPHLLRIASLVPADRVTLTSQTAAQRAGMQLLVFTSEPEAIAWVSGRNAAGGAAPPRR